jgi:nickel/cobalt transporter (NicO) family protein
LNNETLFLILTAGSIGFVHTILGPDHYIPFIVLSKDRHWPMRKTMFITFLCGLGHVGSSLILGLAGIALGWSLTSLNIFESHRGDIAGWLLIGFGLVYMIWGIRRAVKNKPHTHFHRHNDGSLHRHEHRHIEEHTHVHAEAGKVSMTPWVLFIIFIFGPCEPLIPLVMYPAAEGNKAGLIGVVIVFSIVTVVTMMAVVSASVLGLKMIRFNFIEKYSNALAGAIILITGIAVQFLGL